MQNSQFTLFLMYIAFPKDPPFLKCIVLVLLALETAQTAALTSDIIRAFVLGFENAVALDVVGTAWCSIPLMTGLSTSVCASMSYSELY